MMLRYEDVCAAPAAVLDRISDFLEVDRADVQHRSRGADRHIIGNSMRLKGAGEIREDRSWQTKLGSTELARIARIAGPTSHRLGLEWP
jgi:hypothetical protein